MPGQTGFLDRAVTVEGQERKYVIHVPVGYGPGQKWPAILFLHGRGESGTDGRFQLWHGLERAIVRDSEKWPFVAIFPQKPEQDKLWPTEIPTL
ncbi:MAG TPA: hypothetical protein PLX06_03190, partial [Fimbriimonadaceae bacterium]|nr:hypothetical protein [Fimbriimonadaceae bacterium]